MRKQMTGDRRVSRWNMFGLVSAALSMAAVLASSAQAAPERPSGAVASPVASGPEMLRRLSPDQYRNIIADIFGSDIAFGGRFAPEIRERGLLAVGAGLESITADEMDQYRAMAQSIAAQVVDKSQRGILIPCTPASPTTADEQCARKFLAAVGELLYRRPLSTAELQLQVKLANTYAQQEKDFYAGLKESLAVMLVSPKFLFRWSYVNAPANAAGFSALDGYARASQLSFLLWNSSPDETLLSDAQHGELNTPKGLAREVTRMLASPRLETGVRAFFSDMLQFDLFSIPNADSGVPKDTVIYPKFTPQVVADAQEQTLRTLVDLLVTNNGDYRDVFRTRKTFLTPDLASIYGVPLPRVTPLGESSPWEAYEYSPGDPRAGILSEISFAGLHSHPGVTSAVLRGKALRELILCQVVPDPPPNVSFKLVLDTHNSVYKTARERLDAHVTNPVCAGCHKLMDPPGLVFENFDSDGSFRTRENGELIDTSGSLDGKKFDGMTGLGQTIASNPAASACLVTRLAEYAMGRAPTGDEIAWVAGLKKDFIADNYRLPALLRRIATSDMLNRIEWNGAPATTMAKR